VDTLLHIPKETLTRVPSSSGLPGGTAAANPQPPQRSNSSSLFVPGSEKRTSSLSVPGGGVQQAVPPTSTTNISKATPGQRASSAAQQHDNSVFGLLQWPVFVGSAELSVLSWPTSDAFSAWLGLASPSAPSGAGVRAEAPSSSGHTRGLAHAAAPAWCVQQELMAPIQGGVQHVRPADVSGDMARFSRGIAPTPLLRALGNESRAVSASIVEELLDRVRSGLTWQGDGSHASDDTPLIRVRLRIGMFLCRE
jgi:hypothetical protein